MTTTPARLRSASGAGPRAAISEKTLRTDRWWLQPLLVFLGLGAFVVYGLVRAIMDKYYWAAEEHYLAPFYSPA
ncbi:hypothetical protein GCM10027610_131290 [Dactylosporangium cerinum]